MTLPAPPPPPRALTHTLHRCRCVCVCLQIVQINIKKASGMIASGRATGSNEVGPGPLVSRSTHPTEPLLTRS
jgi:hypothetical protein